MRKLLLFLAAVIVGCGSGAGSAVSTQGSTSSVKRGPRPSLSLPCAGSSPVTDPGEHVTAIRCDVGVDPHQPSTYTCNMSTTFVSPYHGGTPLESLTNVLTPLAGLPNIYADSINGTTIALVDPDAGIAFVGSPDMKTVACPPGATMPSVQPRSLTLTCGLTDGAQNMPPFTGVSCGTDASADGFSCAYATPNYSLGEEPIPGLPVYVGFGVLWVDFDAGTARVSDNGAYAECH